MVLNRQNILTMNEKQSDRKKRERDEEKIHNEKKHNAFFFSFFLLTAQGAKHAGKCLESMISANPKALKRLRKKKANTWMDPLTLTSYTAI